MVNTTWTQTAGMTSDTDTDNIEDYAAQAEASKDAAAASETAAAGSASAASTSASNAATDAASALSSKNAAAVSETNAATSETNAASSAASASTSATNANTSASNSATSAAASASSAAAASTSETNSASSAAAALVSENAAAASETAASASASAASTSEANAAASETAASASETAAQTAQAAAEAAEAATEALFDQFGDQYLGPKASDPTVDNDGNPLTEGAVYFNTTDDVLKFYSGSAWVAPESVATTAAAAAQAAQAAAETAETNAETAETNAAASASSASSSASAASTSASEAAASAASINLSSIDIDGGTIDGTVIGGSTPAAGSFTTGSFTGDVAHGDGVKATFGASADLAIFHDGSNSYITDNGAGQLILRGSNSIALNNADNSKNMVVANDGGEVSLYHNGSSKLATTSSGINVTGRIDADDFIVVAGSNPRLQVQDTDGTNQFSFLQQQGSDVFLRARNDTVDGRIVFAGYGGASTTNRLDINSGGDVRFWDETGASAKLVWDTSEEALEFGDNVKATFGASADLEVYHDGSASYIEEKGTGSLYIRGTQLRMQATDGTTYLEANDGGALTLKHNGATVFNTTSTGIDVTGTVAADGLAVSGTSNFVSVSTFGSIVVNGSTNYNHPTSGSATLDWEDDYLRYRFGGSATPQGIRIDNYDEIKIKLNRDGSAYFAGSVELNGWTITESGGSLYFATGGTNKMKLDASGNLDVVGSVNSNATIS